MKTFFDLKYSSHENQVLDFYLPMNDENYDVVLVSLHGGSWAIGDKSEYAPQTAEFAKRLNVPTVNMNYRLTPHTLDDMMEDIEIVLSFITEYAKQYGCDFKRCVLRGFSAGAHIAMNYAYRKSNSPLPVTLFIGEATPTDLAAPLGGPAKGFICRGLSNIIGERITQKNWTDYVPQMEKLSPVNYITPESVPTLLLHGTLDYMVGYKTALKTVEILKSNDVPCDLVTFDECKHQFLEYKMEMVEEYFGKVNSFFAKFSKRK